MRRKSWFNLKMLGFAILLGTLSGCMILFGLNLLRPMEKTPEQSTAIVTVLLAPTLTPPLEEWSSTKTPFFSPTAQAEGGGASIQIGSFVQISGTGGDGLRLRISPGLGSEVRVLGVEAEVFQVEDGPQEADGFTWWYLVGPFDANRHGWAVANFLIVIQNP